MNMSFISAFLTNLIFYRLMWFDFNQALGNWNCNIWVQYGCFVDIYIERFRYHIIFQQTKYS